MLRNLRLFPFAHVLIKKLSVYSCAWIVAGCILKLRRVFAHSGQFGGLTLVLARWRLKRAFIKFCMKRPFYKDLAKQGVDSKAPNKKKFENHWSKIGYWSKLGTTENTLIEILLS